MADKDYDSEKYYNDPEAGQKLLLRLEVAAAMAGKVGEEVRVIINTANGLGIEWHSALESLTHHLSLDLSYIRAEIKKLTGD